MNDFEDRNNGLYITDKYLKKNTKISKKSIQKIAYKVINRKISNDFLVINLIEKILK